MTTQNTAITWHGHSNFQIQYTAPEGVINILIDPFFGPTAKTTWDAVAAPDLILVTHDHGDHVGSAVELAQKYPQAMVASVVGTAESLVARGIPAAQILNGIGFNIGGTVSHKGVAITMTQAFHSSETSVPVGYILTMPDGYTIYHAGDTGIFASMETLGKLYSIDVAMLPIGGVFTMDEAQAAMACSLLQAKSVIPMHWGTFPVLAQSTDAFAEQLELHAPECTLIAMVVG
ncbi:MAG: metal-dependent hydrolase [Pseudomonadota bacterium]